MKFNLGLHLNVTPETSSETKQFQKPEDSVKANNGSLEYRSQRPDDLFQLPNLNLDDMDVEDRGPMCPAPMTNRGGPCFNGVSLKEQCWTPCYKQKNLLHQDSGLADTNQGGSRFGLCSCKTEHRTTQEDRFIACENFNNSSQNGAFAVIDGHGGQKAAEYIRENLVNELLQQRNLSKNTVTSVKQAFGCLDKKFLDIAEQNKYTSGAACLLALIQNGKLSIANLGDCVATLVSSTGRVSKLSVEQTLSRPDEKQRIISNHGTILQNKLNGQLEVSRAFGDRDLKQFVISDPEVHTYQIKASDDLLILSTDGLYKGFSKEHIADKVYQLRQLGWDLKTISETVISECMTTRFDGFVPCRDNLTLLIVSLKDYYNDFKSNHNRRYPKPTFEMFSNSGEGLQLQNQQLSVDASFSSSNQSNNSCFNSEPLFQAGKQASYPGSGSNYSIPQSESSVSSSSERPPKSSPVNKVKFCLPFEMDTIDKRCNQLPFVLNFKNAQTNQCLQLRQEETIVQAEDDVQMSDL